MRLNRERGASAVEFAIVLPLLLVLVFGIIEFGLLFFNRQVLTNASREAARYGIVSRSPRRTPAEIAQVANDYCASYLITFGSSTPVINSAAYDPSGTPKAHADAVFGDDLAVTVQFQYDFLALPNFVAGIVGPSTNIATQAVMKYE